MARIRKAFRLHLLGIGLLCGLLAPRVYADAKLAFVDMQRAIEETEDGRTAKAQLKKLFQRRQTELDEKQESIKRMQEELEKQRNILSKDALQKRLETYQKTVVELQTAYMGYQKELGEKEAQLTKRILIRMERILRQIGTREGYTMIFDRSGGVVWAPSHLDLTDKLIQMYNAGGGTEEGESPPTKAKGGGPAKRTP